MAKKRTKIQPESTTPEPIETKSETASESEIPKTGIEDPIGDVTDGEAKATLEPEAATAQKKPSSARKKRSKKAASQPEAEAATQAQASAKIELDSQPEIETLTENQPESQPEVKASSTAPPEIKAETASEAESARPEGGGGFNPRKKSAVRSRALAPDHEEPQLEEPQAQQGEPLVNSKEPAANSGEPAALKGHDFSRAATAAKRKRALAPEGDFASTAPESPNSPSDSEAETQPLIDSEPEDESTPRPPAKLERLQKILAASGIASRRRAEELIQQGRVQLNGRVVTVLGTKADAARDHIRVDGKLLQGAERLRYFVLNKPRGFVTTVKDPEGRPTVMQFFEKMKERLYPVGRLDYMSEGLLVVTNDGELANRLTKASSGVEKTYLVKVAGQPTESELDILRGGVAIDRGAPGSAKIHTAPARIRQVRQGDNPWFEVVLIEGRNRELRKMFEEIGHFVEKIRRVGYGPLILDQEPGKLRELEPRELELLRKAAEGKLATPKAKEIRRRNAADAGLLPTVRPKPSSRPLPPAQPFVSPAAATERPAGYRPKFSDRPARPFDKRGPGQRPARPFQSGKPFRPEQFHPERGGAEGFRPAAGRTSAPNPVRSFSRNEDEHPHRGSSGGQANFGSARPAGRSFDRPAYERPGAGSARPGARPDRPASAATGRQDSGRPFTSKPNFEKPAWKRSERPERGGRPDFKRSAPPRREAPRREPRAFDDDLGPVRPPNLRIEEIKPERPGSSRPFQPRSNAPRPASGPGPGPGSGPRSARPAGSRPFSDRPRPSRPGGQDRPSSDRPASSARPGSARFGAPRPFRGEGGLARPFTTSSGKPRPGRARPSNKRSSPAERSSSAGWKPERKSGSDWKPRPGSGGPGKPGAGSGSKPRPGGFKSSGYRGKPSGPKRSGRPGGKKRG